MTPVTDPTRLAEPDPATGGVQIRRLSYDVLRRQDGEVALVVHEGDDAGFRVSDCGSAEMVVNHLVLRSRMGLAWVLAHPVADVLSACIQQAAVRLLVLSQKPDATSPQFVGVYLVPLTNHQGAAHAQA